MVNKPSPNGLNELALFAGGGGGILGGKLLGWRTVCAVEREPFAAGVLIARQNDGTLPPFPVWDDVRTFDGKPWRGIVDVISGGFPCQDISAAGGGAGIMGERSGLWKEFARIIGEVRPRYAFVENSPMLVNRGLGTVLGDLSALGFDAQWGVLSAAEVGAPHLRERIWVVAQRRDILPHPDHQGARRRKQFEACAQKEASGIVANVDGIRELQPQGSECHERGWSSNGTEEDAANTDGEKCSGLRGGKKEESTINRMRDESNRRYQGWDTEPEVGRMVHGVAHRVDRIAALGNGQVPAVAATAWEMLLNI